MPVMIRRFALIGLVLAGAAGIAAARADDEAMEPVWKRYWMAIEAEKQCNNVDFSQAQYDAMVHVINMKVNYGIGAGRRHQLMSDAKSEVYDLAFKYGCNSPELTNLLALYRSELAPVVK